MSDGPCCGACEHGERVAAGEVADPAPSPQLRLDDTVRLEIVAEVARQGDRRFPMQKDRVTVGRAKHNDVALEDHTLSRVTCEISVAPNGVVHVRDLNSACGTWLGKAKVGGEPMPVHENDTIHVGTSKLQTSPCSGLAYSKFFASKATDWRKTAGGAARSPAAAPGAGADMD